MSLWEHLAEHLRDYAAAHDGRALFLTGYPSDVWDLNTKHALNGLRADWLAVRERLDAPIVWVITDCPHFKDSPGLKRGTARELPFAAPGLVAMWGRQLGDGVFELSAGW